MTTDFYRQFEDQFRASRSVIKERLRFYDPILNLVSRLPKPLHALDLGCGRGEWLEVLLSAGFEAQGVDLDQGMLQACQELGLPARTGDALEALQQSKDNSLALVSAFHLVEHIAFDTLLDLVKHAHRALAPGGVLIMETPNAENISVGTSSFYLDPTHSKPIPHALLAFVTEYHGFAAHKVMRVNEDPQLNERPSVSLSDVIFGVSPDYAVVAIKGGNNSVLTPFKALVSRNYGVAIETLAQRYDQQINNQLRTIAGAPGQSPMTRDILLNEIAHLKTEHHSTKEQLKQVYNSTSWRVTRPMRALVRLLAACRNKESGGIWGVIATYLQSNPEREARVVGWLKRLQLNGIAEKLATPEKPRARDKSVTVAAPMLNLSPDVRELNALVLSELSPRKKD